MTGRNPPSPDALALWVLQQHRLPIMITDAAGLIEYVNPAFEQSTGYCIDELLGANPRILSAGQTPPTVYAALWQTVSSGETWEGQLINRRKNNEVYTEHLNITPLRDENGAVRRYFAIARDLSELSVAKHRIEQLSSIDALTGLPSRSNFIAWLTDVIRVAEAAGQEFWLVCIDLDRFKLLNESLGQRIADQVLIDVGERLRGAVRQDDGIARLGADEFALLLTEPLPFPGQGDVMRRFQQVFGEPLTVDGHEIRLTVSFGVAAYPLDGKHVDALLGAAEAALACSTAEGGDRATWFHPDMLAGSLTRFDLAAQLRRAVAQQELVLYYQPQVDLQSGRVVGMEALVRWRHPEQGMLPPSRFIGYAEEMGLSWQIDEWVLREACRQGKAWRTANLPPLRMAVNLSARYFQSGNLPETVAAILAETGFEARQLELELTETAMMRDPIAAIRCVDRLKSLGVRLSLDDFGTGYSSLAYLSRFAIDTLKIDQSFVRDVTSNPLNASIITATIAMARKLGKKVLAEGVETAGQMHFLRRQQCDEMQGFYFSKPLPAEDLAALLRAEKRLDIGIESAGQPQHTLLLVDDDPGVLNALRRLFRREGYRVLAASSADAALDTLATQPVQVIISDQRMPGMSGVEFLSRVRVLYPETIRIVLSGYAEIDMATEAINRGAIWKLLSKPWKGDELREEVRRAFRLVEETRP